MNIGWNKHVIFNNTDRTEYELSYPIQIELVSLPSLIYDFYQHKIKAFKN